MKAWPLFLGLFAIVLGFGSCIGTCGSDEHLAELNAVVGERVERDSARDVGRFRAAVVGDRFFMGDGLRTGVACTAVLALSPSGLAYVEPRTVLRFLANAPESGAAQLVLENGGVEIIAEQMDVEIHTPRAVTRLLRGSKVKISADDGHERFDLLVGRVFVTHEGKEKTLTTARPLELLPTPHFESESARAGPDASGDASAPQAEPPLAEDARDPQLQAPEEVRETQPDLLLHELSTATIHAARMPVHVQLPLPPCEQRIEVRLGGRPAQSDGRLRLAAGRHRVRVLCGAQLVQESQITVKRDTAKQELAKSAQNVRVEADGRRYTVLYQNLLPVVSFVWPGTREGDAFTLFLQRGGKEKPLSYALGHAEHTLPGHVLGEGEHKFWFRDAHGRVSKTGSVRLSFDNTARSAYLSSPAEGSAAGAGNVLVEGAALVRSAVDINGVPVPVDAKGRFRSEVQLEPGKRSVNVRVVHPKGGVHYYLRRLR